MYRIYLCIWIYQRKCNKWNLCSGKKRKKKEKNHRWNHMKEIKSYMFLIFVDFTFYMSCMYAFLLILSLNYYFRNWWWQSGCRNMFSNNKFCKMATYFISRCPTSTYSMLYQRNSGEFAENMKTSGKDWSMPNGHMSSTLYV